MVYVAAPLSPGLTFPPSLLPPLLLTAPPLFPPFPFLLSLLALQCSLLPRGASSERCLPPPPSLPWWLDRAPFPVDFDAADAEDVCSCGLHAAEIYANLRVSERRLRPSTSYMESVQTEINPLMRSILVDWLVEVAQEYRLCSDSLFLSVALLDRYLSRRRVPRAKLQLAGVACALVASKYEEIYAPAVDDFVYITDATYRREEVLAAERDVLKALDHSLTAPTAKAFLRRAVRAAAAQLDADAAFEHLAAYCAELSLLDYQMLRFVPSQVAAACVLVALACLGRQPWSATLSAATGYAPPDLRAPAEAIHALLVAAKKSALPAIRDKYASRRLGAVSHIALAEKLPAWLWKP